MKSIPAVGGAFTVEPLNQPNRSQLSLADLPFIVDTGATVHISPERTDFLSL
jgi:hypothetical protein